MRAAYYEEQGPAHDVVRVGEVPTPEPGPGEVRVRVAVSGVHVGDVGKRRGYWGSTMTYPRVIPHGDGAGTVDAVGPGVDPARVGERVWVYLAQSYRPFGTAAEYTVVPAGHAVRLPDGVGWEQAAVVGIPGITGHRAEQVDEVLAAGAHHVVVLGADAARQIRAIAPDGVDRVAEIDLAGNAALDVEILSVGGTIATYATGDPGASLPYWPLAFRNITIQFLSNDDFPDPANEHAARDLTAALAAGDLRYPIAARFPLDRTADAQDAAERTGAAGRVVVEIDA
ncbi:alcohol dehydrogenase catalytic domain-containing protein [Pseudonocardia cypriaca]|uniref:NADPH2:quinone reductase n=1 Tax=Pseudonocardia cypriaca TaxID=882449 RepID=A0A543FTF4_9PSEU|nr:zinc-binding dehydrogenase [Pseudonocardia cypriaca]TQM37106.1 NADPH2:quinone reductase [Pseudonocardia cypriaca]